MKDEKIIEKLRALIEQGVSLSESLERGEGNIAIGSHRTLAHNRQYYEKAVNWKGACINLLEIRFGKDSLYLKDFILRIKERDEYSGEFYKEKIAKATGVLRYVLDALESGLTEDLFYQREILLFSDLLKQAYEFFEKGFKEAAAIYGRIVLELTIKELASKNGIEENTFDQTIIKLRQAGIIHQPFETSLRAQYQTGSLATHNNEEFKKLSDSEIKEYLNFIRDRVLTLKWYIQNFILKILKV